MWGGGGGVGNMRTTARDFYIETLVVMKPNSLTYNFIEVSGHNLESSQT
jgi:hypothetical protein